MVAELRFDRRVGRLPFVQLQQGFGELRNVAGWIGPVQIAALGAGARVLGLFLGDVFKLSTLFQAGNDGRRFGFFFDQNVARLEFLAAVGCRELVVFGLQVGISDRMGLLVVGKQFANHQGLARQFHLHLEVVAGGNALLFGFLHEHFTGNDFLAQLAFHFRRDRAAGLGNLLRQRIQAGFRHGLAVDDSKVLGHGTLRAHCQKACHCSGQ